MNNNNREHICQRSNCNFAVKKYEGKWVLCVGTVLLTIEFCPYCGEELKMTRERAIEILSNDISYTPLSQEAFNYVKENLK